MSRFLTVAAAQFASRTADMGANAAPHLEMIARARALGADVLVFPELSLAGHDGTDALLDMAMDKENDRRLALSRAAGEREIVVGFIEEARGAQFYDSAAILKPGRLRYVHRKINLPSHGRLVDTKFYSHGRFVDTHATARTGRWAC